MAAAASRMGNTLAMVTDSPFRKACANHSRSALRGLTITSLHLPTQQGRKQEAADKASAGQSRDIRPAGKKDLAHRQQSKRGCRVQHHRVLSIDSCKPRFVMRSKVARTPRPTNKVHVRTGADRIDDATQPAGNPDSNRTHAPDAPVISTFLPRCHPTAIPQRLQRGNAHRRRCGCAFMVTFPGFAASGRLAAPCIPPKRRAWSIANRHENQRPLAPAKVGRARNPRHRHAERSHPTTRGNTLACSSFDLGPASLAVGGVQR